MSEEPGALKCFLIAQSSNINQFNHALRLPPAVYFILIFEQTVDGCVLTAGESETTYGGPPISTCGEAKKDERCLPIQGIWLQLLRSFSQMQTNWAFSGKGIARHQKADGWEDQWRRMAGWKRRMEGSGWGEKSHGGPRFQLILAHFVYGYIIKAGTTDPSAHTVVNLCLTWSGSTFKYAAGQKCCCFKNSLVSIRTWLFVLITATLIFVSHKWKEC